MGTVPYRLGRTSLSTTCASLAESVSAAADGELSSAERARLDVHLADCADCRGELVRLTELRRRTLVAGAPALDGLVRRIVASAPVPVGRARRRRSRAFGVAAAALLVAALAAGSVALSRDRGPSADPVVAGQGTGRVVTVKIMDQQALQREVTIRAGDVVRWVNTDLDSHHLVIDGGGSTIERSLPRRGTETITYTEPGTYRFECNRHPGLSGTVTVL